MKRLLLIEIQTLTLCMMGIWTHVSYWGPS